MAVNNNKTIVAIIQAHMSSTRLPGKILMDMNGKPLLYRVIERARQSKYLTDVVIATSTLPCDDQIEQVCGEWGVHVFRGSDDDVLERYWGAAQAYPAEVYVRLTSDNPLIDPRQIDDAIEFFLTHDYRYVHTDGQLPLGTGEEIFEAALMREAAENSTEHYEHEHVTPYMYWKQDSVGEVPSKRPAPQYRVTVDTPEDYQVVSAVYQALCNENNDFSLDEVIDFLDAHPEIAAINSKIVQKKATD